MIFPRLVTHSLDVGLRGTNIQERVIDRFRELLRLDQESPIPGSDIVASIATVQNRARARTA